MEKVHERNEYTCCCLCPCVSVNLATAQVHLCLKMLMSDAEAGDEGDGGVMAATSIDDPALTAEGHRGAGARPTDLGQRVARIESALLDNSVRHEGRLASMETSLQVGFALHLLLRAGTSACCAWLKGEKRCEVKFARRKFCTLINSHAGGPEDAKHDLADADRSTSKTS